MSRARVSREKPRPVKHSMCGSQFRAEGAPVKFTGMFNGMVIEQAYQLAPNEWLIPAVKHCAAGAMGAVFQGVVVREMSQEAVGGMLLAHYRHHHATERGEASTIDMPVHDVVLVKAPTGKKSELEPLYKNAVLADMLLGFDSSYFMQRKSVFELKPRMIMPVKGEADLTDVLRVPFEDHREDVSEWQGHDALKDISVRKMMVFQLIDQINQLAKAGVRYSDIKPDNIRIGYTPPSITLIDMDSVCIGAKTPTFTAAYTAGDLFHPGSTRHGLAICIAALLPEYACIQTLKPHPTPDINSPLSSQGLPSQLYVSAPRESLRADAAADDRREHEQYCQLDSCLNQGPTEDKELERVRGLNKGLVYQLDIEENLRGSLLGMGIVSPKEYDLNEDVNTLLRFLGKQRERLVDNKGKTDSSKTQDIARVFGEVRALKQQLRLAFFISSPDERATEVARILQEMVYKVAETGLIASHARAATGYHGSGGSYSDWKGEDMTLKTEAIKTVYDITCLDKRERAAATVEVKPQGYDEAVEINATYTDYNTLCELEWKGREDRTPSAVAELDSDRPMGGAGGSSRT